MLLFFIRFASAYYINFSIMILTKSLGEFKKAFESLPDKESIGFVPTMGALHEGHLSLVQSARKKCRHVIVSVFVNPTQFNNKQDLATYPRTLDADAALLEKEGADILFAPQVEDIYPEEDTRIFDLGGLDKYGEGPRRPGHFNGVAQVVTRLFDIVRPKYAFFGEKDYQQLAIVKYFTKALGYDIEITGCPIVRESDGLAKSSRNTLLTPEQRMAAPHIYKTICRARELKRTLSPQQVIEKIKEEIDSNGLLETEYIEIVDGTDLKPVTKWSDSDNPRLWCAVYARPVRLIDNIAL